MTGDQQLDDLLRSYLDSERRSTWRSEMQARVERLVDQALATDARVTQGFADVTSELRLMRVEHGHLERRVEVLEEADETTGVHELARLRARVDSERAKARAVKRWAAAVAAALIVALLSTGTALAIRALTQ